MTARSTRTFGLRPPPTRQQVVTSTEMTMVSTISTFLWCCPDTFEMQRTTILRRSIRSSSTMTTFQPVSTTTADTMERAVACRRRTRVSRTCSRQRRARRVVYGLNLLTTPSGPSALTCASSRKISGRVSTSWSRRRLHRVQMRAWCVLLSCPCGIFCEVN